MGVAFDKAAAIVDSLKKEFPTKTIVQGDSNGNPTILFNDGSGATNEENFALMIVQRTYSSFPTISLASSQDGRAHRCLLLMEATVNPALVTSLSVWSAINLAKLLRRLSEQNLEIELQLCNNGTVPAVAGIETDPHTNNVAATVIAGTIRTTVYSANAGA